MITREEARAAIAAVAADEARDAARAALATVEIDALFAPLPPIPWLVQKLDMCPGAPTLFAGYGFSGKTLAAQSLALAIAGGGFVWGDFITTRRGRVVHIDHEQGLRLTAERYQRLAAAMTLDADRLRGQLGVASLPKLYLSAPTAPDAYSKACDGAALVIVDSLRASAPDVDENSSEVRRLLDTLTGVSEKTGCVALVIHHARKPSDDASGGAKMAIRGSSAIFDACGSVLVFSASKGEPTRVTHEKARTSGILCDDFTLTINDVEANGGARGGLEVRAGSAPNREQARSDAGDARAAELDADVLAFVRSHPGCTQRNVEAERSFAGRNEAKRYALSRLHMSGAIERRDGPKGYTHWPVLPS